MKIGRRDAIMAKATELRQEYDGDLYGVYENGGTSTIYVSPVKFDELDKSLAVQRSSFKGSITARFKIPKNMLEKQSIWSALSLISPLFGIIAAFFLPGKSEEQED